MTHLEIAYSPHFPHVRICGKGGADSDQYRDLAPIDHAVLPGPRQDKVIFNFSIKVRRDEKVRPEEKLARTVDELLTNAAWTVLVGLTLVVLLAVASATQEPSKPLIQPWVGVLAGFSAYLILNILMVLSRIWTAHEDIKDLPPKK